MNTPIARSAGILLLPLAIGFSIYLLWRGHNEPGGGFVGGLISAGGFVFYALPRGRVALLGTLRWPPLSISGLGLLMALLSGVPGLLSSEPFLTHQWHTWANGLTLGTALLFDIGVYLAVLGSVCAFVDYYMDKEET